MKPIMWSINKQHGVTLVELMISIVLGLIISAAAIQVFITSQRGIAMQQGNANLQNTGLFGLEYMVRDIRLANLNATGTTMDNTGLHGGIVLSNLNLSTDPTFSITGETADNLKTQGQVGLSNLDSQKSDQLVIQYRNTIGNTSDCEGNPINADDYIVQRYFLRADGNGNNDPNEPLALACNAVSYTGDDIAKLDGLDGNGEIIIPRVDHFSVLLGVANDTLNESVSPAVAGADGMLDGFGYITIDDYLALTNKPNIVLVQLGLLVRSPDTVGNHGLTTADKKYKVLNVEAALTADSKNKLYLRDVLTQSVALRNGFGIEN